MGFMSKLLSFGSDKDLKRYYKIVDQINGLEPQFEKMTEEELRGQTDKFRERYANGESLDDMLPEAFATVREASKRTMGMRHFDVQLIGAMALHEGHIAEMKTGEGKTLVSTLAGYLNAIAGKGVHVVTVNDYLAKRDSEWMGRIYKYLGMTVGLLQNNMPLELKRPAYQADVTYGTNSEFGFDYLRDNMVTRPEQRVQRGHNYAIVDEVDSILIDEARTPLIISGAGTKSASTYKDFARAVRGLERGEDVSHDMLTATEDVEPTGDFVMDEAKHTIAATERGLKKIERRLGIDDIYADLSGQLVNHLQQALKAQYMFHRDKQYVVTNGEVKIVDEFTGRIMEGRRYSEGLHQAIEAKEGVLVREENQTLATITLQNYFRLYDKLSGMTGTALTEDAEFREIYKLPVEVIPSNKPVQRVDHEDLVYRTIQAKYNAVADDVEQRHAKGQPVLVGTVSIESSEKLSAALTKRGIAHEVLNAKHHEREAHIVAQAGRYGAVTIATNMAGRGTDIKLSQEVKAAGGLAIIGTERHESRRVDRQLRGRAGRQGDPGSSVFFVSLEDDLMRLFASEKIAGLMDKLGFKEGEVLEHSMLSKSVERAQKKVEENNFGIRKRLLEYDDVMNSQRNVIYTRRRHALMGERIGLDVLNTIYDTSVAIVDQHADGDYEGFKLELFKTFAMECPFTEEEFKNGKADKLADKLFDEALQLFKRRMERMTQVANPVIKQVYEHQGAMYENIMIPITDGKRMYNVSCNLKEAYETESKAITKAFQKSIVLHTIDEAWKEHLREMDELRHSVQNASYENKDPLLIYKLESYNLFKNMVDMMNRKTAAVLMRGQIPVREEPTEEEKQAMAARQAAMEEAARQRIAIQRAEAERHQDMSKYRTEKTDISGNNNPEERAQQQPRQEPVRAEKRVGRNDPCPCGSGKKYKNCHGQGL